MTLLSPSIETLEGFEPRGVAGTVDSVRGMTVLVRRFRVPIGSVVRIESGSRGTRSVLGEVIGFDETRAIVMLLGGSTGTSPGDRVRLERVSDSVMVGDSWLGRVLNGLGQPIDGGPPLSPPVFARWMASSPSARGSGSASSPVPASVRAR